VVDKPESNRRPMACAIALPLSYCPSTTHRKGIPGIRHGSTARTGQARLPPRTCAAVDVSRDASFIGVANHRKRCAVTSILCANATARRPRRSIQAQR